MPTTAITRKITVTPSDWQDLFEDFALSQVIYLAECFNEFGRQQAFYRISPDPFRTNSSQEDRINGWLGCTNGVNCTAIGRFEIESLTEVSDRKYLFELTKIDDD